MPRISCNVVAVIVRSLMPFAQPHRSNCRSFGYFGPGLDLGLQLILQADSYSSPRTSAPHVCSTWRVADLAGHRESARIKHTPENAVAQTQNSRAALCYRLPYRIKLHSDIAAGLYNYIRVPANEEET